MRLSACGVIAVCAMSLTGRNACPTVQAAEGPNAGQAAVPAAGVETPAAPPKEGEVKVTGRDAPATDAKTTDAKATTADTPPPAPAAGSESRGSRHGGAGRGSWRDGRTADAKAPPADAQNPGEAAVPASGWARYQVLTERNMFLKNRAKPRVFEAKQEEMGPPAPKVETDVVLSGIVEKDGQLVAFLENSRSGSVRIVRKNDEVGAGKIGAITISSIEYICNGATRTVNVGTTLEGGSIANLGTAKTGSGSSETDSVLERLRRKRQEEMSK